MNMAEDEVTAAFQPFAPQYPSIANLLTDEQEPSFTEDDSAMDIVANPSEPTAAFAQSTALQRFSRKQMNEDDTVEENEVAIALGAPHPAVEYEVPLGAEGIHQEDDTEDVAFGQNQASGEDDTASTMDMSMEVDNTMAYQNGAVISDGKTSRRISTSGAVRRGSLAPGLKALAILDAEEEEEEEEEQYAAQDEPLAEEEEPNDDDRTMDMEETAVFNNNNSQSQSHPKPPRFSLNPATGSQPLYQPSPAEKQSPRRQSLAPALASRIPLPSKTPDRPRASVAPAPSSLARPSPETVERLRSPLKAVARQSLLINHAIATEQNREDVVPDEVNRLCRLISLPLTCLQGLNLLTLDEFFSLTGMHFMDDLFSAKRKSTGSEEAETTNSKPSAASRHMC